jgi:ribokinase
VVKDAVIVVGGLTMDLSYYVDSWPRVREAVQAKSYALVPGGKGLNQATAVARMGLKVNLISSIGDDSFSDQILTFLKTEKIDGVNILRQKSTPTDLIGIIVGLDGEPGFIGIKTANSKLLSKDIESKQSLIKSSAILMVNTEIPVETALTALKIAKANGLTTIFNPAPPDHIPDGILKFVDYFVPNEWEAKVLYPSGSRLSAGELAKRYHEMGAKVACVTLGENGCVVATDKGVKPYVAFSVDEVDATGAGDSFCGALAYSVTQEWDLEKSIRFASAAGALACTKPGARLSAPTLSEVNRFLNVRIS